MGSSRPEAEIAARLTRGPNSAAELVRALAVSQSTISRTLRVLERDQRVLRMGSTRGTRYALRRSIAQVGSRWPIYRIDEKGIPRELGSLSALRPDGYYADASAERIAGVFDGIPYYLQDARPQGFLGRALPAALPELDLPPRVTDWTDDHFLTYLVQRGTDAGGSLIVGLDALNRHLAGRDGPPTIGIESRSTAYPAFASAAMAGAPPGSSAQGEHPKFTCRISNGECLTPVIVKFSPSISTPTGRRWADLLRAEYVAHRVLEEHGVAACRSVLLECGERVFLECERFDRVGAEGRRGAVTLLALDVARYGKLDSWTASAERLQSDAVLAAEDAERIRFLDAFGALIANSDRHFGNVTLFDRFEGPFELAPAYDMLPMLFAPQDDQLVPRRLDAVRPRAEWLSVWPRARSIAEAYWMRLMEEPGMSPEFRAISADCLAAVRATTGLDGS